MFQRPSRNVTFTYQPSSSGDSTSATLVKPPESIVAVVPEPSDATSVPSPSRKGKRRASQSVPPSEARMTRSASLRQQNGNIEVAQKGKGSKQAAKVGSTSKMAATGGGSSESQ